MCFRVHRILKVYKKIKTKMQEDRIKILKVRKYIEKII